MFESKFILFVFEIWIVVKGSNVQLSYLDISRMVSAAYCLLGKSYLIFLLLTRKNVSLRSLSYLYLSVRVCVWMRARACVCACSTPVRSSIEQNLNVITADRKPVLKVKKVGWHFFQNRFSPVLSLWIAHFLSFWKHWVPRRSALLKENIESIFCCFVVTARLRLSRFCWGSPKVFPK